MSQAAIGSLELQSESRIAYDVHSVVMHLPLKVYSEV